MPFTFSHPAIVLPLTFLPRQWFSLTGLDFKQYGNVIVTAISAGLISLIITPWLTRLKEE